VPWPEREDYTMPSRHLDYVREIIDDSTGTPKQRREYVEDVLANMYHASGVMKYVESYAQTLSNIYLQEPAIVGDTPRAYQTSYVRYEVFVAGSLLATHSLISPIKSDHIRLDLRLRGDYASVTDFGQLDDDMSRQQAVLYHEQNIDQL